ncbi:MAG: hypothetical protein KAQ68_05265 [Clostridiales bacterium]|nr:hypothetical protein [Clostridiales bacterium]
MNENIRLIDTEEEIKIFSDPYRLKIINTYKKINEPLTVKKVADEMGEVPAKIHYHVKKLLSIKILELDHIEVINGINAKYYRLTANEFRIDLSKISDSVAYQKHAGKVESLISSLLNDFMETFARVSLSKTNNEKKNDEHSATISAPDLYLTDEEFKAFEKELKKLISKYSKKDSTKTEYKSIFGLVKNIKE